ncbi:MAG: type III-B CRISPR module-associated Cmr3 family protein [Eubacteriales bacterium]
MHALTFTISLLEPLLVTRVGAGDPNSARSFNYIPGSVIRGALIGRYLQGRNPSGGKTDAADREFRRLFFDGSVCFLNAYPLSRRGGRTLPTPFSWRVEKDEDEPVFDFAMEVVDDPKKMWRRLDKPYCHLYRVNEGGMRTEFYQPAWQVNIHIDRRNRQQANKKGEGNVFRYQALACGEKFAGAVVFDGSSLAAGLEQVQNGIEKLLPGGETYNLGGSHLAGYGRVRIDAVDLVDNWAECIPLGDNADNEEVVVTLLSDALIRESDTGAWAADLGPILGRPHKNAFIRTCLVGGFNRTWNLPLIQSQAIQAGSVFVYKQTGDILKRMLELEKSGIGERRAEGFGRLAVNWHRAKKVEVQEKIKPEKPQPFTLGDSTSISLARRMVGRMLRAELDESLVKSVNRFNINPAVKVPHKSQLARLRGAARQALSENEAGILLEHMKDMKKAAREQFRQARILGEALDDWLVSMASEPQKVWDILAVDLNRLPSVGGVKTDLTAELALEYVVRLIDGVLVKAAKGGEE